MIHIPLDVDVHCIDGLAGKSSAVIVDPETVQASHFVLKEIRKPHTERLVPIETVQETTEDLIHLSCTLDELSAMDKFVVTTFRQVVILKPLQTATTITQEVKVYEEEKELIPEGEIAIRAGSDVLDREGKKVGRVTNLLEDPDNGQITHFVMREDHLWGDKEVILPVSLVRSVGKKAVNLRIDRQAISAMLAIPLRGTGNLTDTILAIVTFPETGKAKSFLEKLQKETSVRFSNAAVLVKDKDGKTSLREIHDLDQRRGAVFGAITGGLVGLLGGPVGVIVGAAAGAASGGVAAGKIDMGFPDNFLKKLQEGLQPDNSALVILLERNQSAIIADAAASHGGQYLQHELTQDILAQLPDTSDN